MVAARLEFQPISVALAQPPHLYKERPLWFAIADRAETLALPSLSLALSMRVRRCSRNRHGQEAGCGTTADTSQPPPPPCHACSLLTKPADGHMERVNVVCWWEMAGTVHYYDCNIAAGRQLSGWRYSDHSTHTRTLTDIHTHSLESSEKWESRRALRLRVEMAGEGLTLDSYCYYLLLIIWILNSRPRILDP